MEGLLTSLSFGASVLPVYDLERLGVTRVRDLPYRPTDREEHCLDIYRPVGTTDRDRLPVVLYIHGGGFHILSKETHWVFGAAFARMGYVVFNINYRLAGTAPFPAAIEDCAHALAWVHDNAHLYGGDPSRIVIAGESAGGNLTTALGIVCAYERDEPFAREVFQRGIAPKAIAPACGFLNVTDARRYFRHPKLQHGVINAVLTRHVGDMERGYRTRSGVTDPRALELCDTLTVFERGDKPHRPLPPFFIPCGGADPLVVDSRRLARALTQLGVDHEQPEYKGEGHAFHAMTFRTVAKQCWRDHERFLRTRV